MYQVLAPLYAIETLRADPLFMSYMALSWGFASIPGNFLWGRLVERFGRYRAFVGAPFLFMGLLMSVEIDSNAKLLIIWSGLGLSYSMFRPASNLLIAETTSFTRWVAKLAEYMFLRGLASVVGLFLATSLSPTLDYRTFFLIAAGLSLLSFPAYLFLVREPILKIERSMSRIDTEIQRVERSVRLLSRLNRPEDAASISSELSKIWGGSYKALTYGTLAFAFGANMVFTPIPVMLQELFQDRGTVASIYFASALGSTVTYYVLMHLSTGGIRRAALSSFIRAVIVLSLWPMMLVSKEISWFLAMACFFLIGSSWSLFEVSTSYSSIRLSPRGGSGLVASILELGALGGSLLGGLFASSFGFVPLFILGSITFFIASAILVRVRD